MLISQIKQACVGLRHDLLLATFAFISVLALIPIFTYWSFAADLSNKEKLFNKVDQGIILYDIKNRPFFTFYQAKVKKEVPLSEIPKVTQVAVIAIEDKDYYSNLGFSPKAILRAAVTNITQKSLSYGGSTITQQLVKNTLLNTKKDFLRKYQEVVLAQEVNRRYSKDQILEKYLNSAYFGAGAFGIHDAAKTYFNKEARDLNLAESALLAGLLPAPSRFSPLTNGMEQAKIRQSLVLRKMVEQKYITLKQEDEAKKQSLNISFHYDDINQIGTHFALMVKDQLVSQYGEETLARSGFRVYTSLDLDWQKYAEEEISKQVENLKKSNVSNGSAVVIDSKSGEIRVLVGSKDWYNEQFGKVNVATSLRQAGSAFKPIVYLAAFEKRLITPATLLKDHPTTFKNDIQANLTAANPNAFYKPQNYDRQFRGLVTVRRALSNSLNVPAVEVMSKLGLGNTLEMANRLGITTLQDPTNYGLSLVLGTGGVKLLELTNAYATLANHGLKNDPTAILRIEDKAGQVLYEYTPENETVADPADVFLVSSILSDNESRGEIFGKVLTISRPAAVKTGTTEDYKDAWTLGYTPSLAVGVWVGNNDNQQMTKVAGSLGAAPIWKALMEKFSQGIPVEKFESPPDIVVLKVCKHNGLVVSEATTSAVIDEYFIKGTQPVKKCYSSEFKGPKSDLKVN